MTIPESEMERLKTQGNSPARMPALPAAEDEPIEPVGYDFGLSRRGFVQILSAGLLIATAFRLPWRKGVADEVVLAAAARKRSRRESIWAKTARSPCSPVKSKPARARAP